MNQKGIAGFELVIILVIIAILSFVACAVTTEGRIRQQIIAEKTGKQVSLWEAMNYPDQYFNDATVRIEK